MRVLGVGEWCDFGDGYRRLTAAAHAVRVHVADPAARGVMEGVVERTAAWQEDLAWVREAGSDGLIVFEDAKQGALHDQLRSKGYRVVGGSAYGSLLEGDRARAQRELTEVGLATLETRAFADFAEAIAFLRERRGRWVCKYNGDRFPSTWTTVGELEDARDLIAVLEARRAQWRGDDRPSFVLMRRVDGVEVGVGGWFDGEAFVDGARCIDFEHKRFFPRDLGELTGEMGTLASYRGGERIFEATLAKLAPRLRAANHRGWVNLNTIIDERGIWPLEFTCRFGYPGFAVLDALQLDDWATILARVAGGGSAPLRTLPGWSVGVVLTTPPFPRLRAPDEPDERLPVLFRRELTPDEQRHLHYGELALQDGQLVSSGVMGNLMVVTAVDRSVREAQRRANTLASQVVTPNLRWRNDIGERFLARDRELLTRWGWLDPELPW